MNVKVADEIVEVAVPFLAPVEVATWLEVLFGKAKLVGELVHFQPSAASLPNWNADGVNLIVPLILLLPFVKAVVFVTAKFQPTLLKRVSLTTTVLLSDSFDSVVPPLKMVFVLTVPNGKLGTASKDNLAVVSELSSWILRVAVLYWVLVSAVVSAFTAGTLKTKTPPRANVNKFNFENNFIILATS